MKRMFLALLAVAAMVGCENTDLNDDNITFKFEDGIYVSDAFTPISYELYCEKVVGSAWKIDFNSGRRIWQDGTLAEENYFYLLNGWRATHYSFDKDSLTEYLWYGTGCKYHTYATHYDNGVVMNDDLETPLFTADGGTWNHENPVPHFVILEVKGDRMTCVQFIGWTPKSEASYILCKYDRLSKSEYEQLKKEYSEEIK